MTSIRGKLASIIRSLHYGVVVSVVLVLLPLSSAAWAEGMLGANAVDLLQQYLGYASNGDGSPAYEKVTRAMARKAILDARDAGFKFLRISASGFYPIVPGGPRQDVLLLWHTNPIAFWRGVDMMFDDLDKVKIRLVPVLNWNYVQFPCMVGDTTADFIGKQRSRSRALASRFITEFVSRYRSRPTVLFYELTNEFNLLADLDLSRRCLRESSNDLRRCASVGNFSTADLHGFASDMATVVRRADPGHLVSPGYSLPRPGSMHLAQRPEWAKGGPDWTPDSVAEFSRYLDATEKDFDIVSIHVYPNDRRFDRWSAADVVRIAAQIAHRLGKKLFVGEFGDRTASVYLQQMVQLIDDGSADYAAIWAWEFYQSATFGSFSRDSIEPGYRDDTIAILRQQRSPDAGPPSVPRVVLTWPLPCVRVDRPITLAAVASEGGEAPERVEFLVDGAPVGQVLVPPYRLEFDPSVYTAKLATIEARARGRSGEIASDSSPLLLNGTSEACNIASH